MFKFLRKKRTSTLEVEATRKEAYDSTDASQKKLDATFASLEAMMDQTLTQLQVAGTRLLEDKTKEASKSD